jgi:hypothetical protein
VSDVEDAFFAGEPITDVGANIAELFFARFKNKGDVVAWSNGPQVHCDATLIKEGAGVQPDFSVGMMFFF